MTLCACYTDWETEGQRGSGTSPRSPSKGVAELTFTCAGTPHLSFPHHPLQ